MDVISKIEPQPRKKTGGRQPGSPNKLSQTAKENIEGVFQKLGGQKTMMHWARRNLTEFYRIYARLLPQTEYTFNQLIEGIPLNRITLSQLSDHEIEQIYNGRVTKSLVRRLIDLTREQSHGGGEGTGTTFEGTPTARDISGTLEPPLGTAEDNAGGGTV